MEGINERRSTGMRTSMEEIYREMDIHGRRMSVEEIYRVEGINERRSVGWRTSVGGDLQGGGHL